MGLLALRSLLGLVFAGALLASGSAAAAPGEKAESPRIEARSATFLAVGVVHEGRMTIRLSRLIDNTPVRDAVLTVLLRGVAHPTIAETDGSYAFETKDLTLPGAASVQIQVSEGDVQENLKGTLQIAGAGTLPGEKNSARQFWWWILNFGVCIGVLLLISRRRKSAQS
jgi:hypothetical protein